MKHYPVILSVAGSDCSGGAGIQADIKTISALGGYAAAAITAVTVQNTLGVQAIHTVPPDIVRKQIEAVCDDLQPECIKIGMIGNADIAHAVADALKKYPTCPVVYDPVMVSTSGHLLMERKAMEEIKQTLFPLTVLLTPNLHEAVALTGNSITNIDEMITAGRLLANEYQTSVLIKGGHLEGKEMCDILCSFEGTTHIYKGEKIQTCNLHGTGCTLSSAIATLLGEGYRMEEAVKRSKEYVSRAIAAAKDFHIGKGNGPLLHFADTVR